MADTRMPEAALVRRWEAMVFYKGRFVFPARLAGALLWGGLSAAMCGAVAGCHSVPPPKPLEQLTATEQAGHAVYRQHCSLCHYDREDKALNGPALLGLYKKPYLPSGAPANDDRVRNTIAHGRNNMPAQGAQLTEDDMSDLLAYLHTL